MAGRLKICILIATCAVASRPAWAQGPQALGGAGYQPGVMAFNSHADAWVGGGSPQAGATMAHPYTLGRVAPVNTASGVGYYDDDGTIVTRSELVTRDEWEDDGELGVHPLEKCISRAVRSSWFRFDYLNTSISDLDGETASFDLTSIGQHGVSGVQTTLGLPTNFGSFEISGFLLEQSSDEVVASGFVGASGGLSRFTSHVWGADVNFIMDPVEPGEGFKLRPMGGFRYFAIQEALKVPGEPSGLDPYFRSETFNNILAPQFGLRTELVHRWFTIGAEPKVGFGTNIFDAELTNNGLLSTLTPNSSEDNTIFAPFFDLDVYAHVPLNEHWSFYVAYNLLLMGGVSRPMDNVAYDSVGGNYHLDTDSRIFRLDGYTVGIEFIF